MAELHNKDGSLSAFGFACGYYQTETIKTDSVDIVLQLWFEGACYHVRAHNFNGEGRLFWESFQLGQLGKARAFFASSFKSLSAKHGKG